MIGIVRNVRLAAALVVAVTAGCAEMHDRFPDASVPSDAGEAPPSPAAGGPHTGVVTCGFNTCAPGEVCCSALCGICGRPDTCAGDFCVADHIVCGGQTCAEGVAVCCPTCDGDVCAATGIDDRSGCPPVSCP